MKRQIPPDTGSVSAAPLPMAEPGAQGDDSEPWGYFIGGCGHRVPGGPVFYVGPCEDCDVDATSPPHAHPVGVIPGQEWTCAVCGLDWACTAVHPALAVIGLLPTPELRTAAFLALLCTEVARRSGKEHTIWPPSSLSPWIR